MNQYKYDKDEIKTSLSIEQVFDLVSELGGEPILKDGYIISKTICHNYVGCGSYKLYYYDNTKLFKCYTDCDDSFDLFELVRKQKTLANKEEWSLYRAIDYVAFYFSISSKLSTFDKIESLSDWDKIKNYNEISENEDKKQKIELKTFNSKILDFLPKPIIVPWEKEGIKREIINKRGIAYDPIYNGIIIPHYDINNNLVGIRERALSKEDEKLYGKYRPAILNGKMYNHPLSFNLYNINNSKNNIKASKIAIVGEGEKFCLAYASYFGEENDISVACCGSSLITYQVLLLLSLGIEEIVIAFDKQFIELNDSEWERWVKKLYNIYNKYKAYVRISFMFDKWNLLDYKDSPIDKGQEVFLELFNKRISLE